MRLLRKRAMALAIVAGSLAATVPALPQDRYPGPDSYGVPYPLSWQGSYAGVHLGFGDGDGVVGGAQIGYNWQSGRVVYGIEADFAFSSMEEEASGCIPGAGCVFAGASLDWLATVRGRVGYLIDPRILAYATAGFGIASWSAEAGVTGPGFEDIRVEFDGTETDFVFGLGVEGKINEAMTARLEFLGFSDFDVDIVRVGLNFKLGR
jgi:outer membrane immunogenic protein